MSIYEKTISNLLTSTKNYKQKKIKLDEYQLSIWRAASEIVLIEEKELRNFLQKAEGKLELLRFTVDENMIDTFEPSLKIVSEIEKRLQKEL